MNSLKNFTDSQKRCDEVFNRGGRLFEPKDELSGDNVRKAQIKLNLGHTGTWIGVKATGPTTYEYASNEKNETTDIPKRHYRHSTTHHDQNEYCLYLQYSNGTWSDQLCSDIADYICEENRGEYNV